MNLATLFSTSQLIGGALIGFSYIPMIIKIHKTKSTINQSFWFWTILDVGMFLCELNALYLGITLGQRAYVISQSLNLLCGLIVLGQLLIYRNNK